MCHKTITCVFIHKNFIYITLSKQKKTKVDPRHHIGVNVWIFLQYSHARNKGFPNSDWYPTLPTCSSYILPKLWKFEEIWSSSSWDMDSWILATIYRYTMDVCMYNHIFSRFCNFQILASKKSTDFILGSLESEYFILCYRLYNKFDFQGHQRLQEVKNGCMDV